MIRRVVVVVTAALALAACSVEVVEGDGGTPSPDTGGAAPTVPGADPLGDAEPARESAKPAEVGEVDASVELPGRDDLRGRTTGLMTCDGGDGETALAGSAVEVTDDCATLTVGGAGAVVVAREVDDLVVTGAGARVAVVRVGTVTIDAADVTVTWEDGSPAVTDRGAASTYGTAATR